MPRRHINARPRVSPARLALIVPGPQYLPPDKRKGPETATSDPFTDRPLVTTGGNGGCSTDGRT